MADALSLVTLLLRWLHFVGGFIWFGLIFFLAFAWEWVTERATGDSRFLGRLTHTLIGSSTVTIMAGVILALIKSQLRTEVFLGTYWGRVILAGGFLALAILASLFSFVIPALEGAENASLGHARRWVKLDTALAVLVLFFMALAVNPI